MNFSVGQIWRPLSGALRTGVALSVAALLVSACTEKLDSSAGCPIACLDPSAAVQTTTLTAAVNVDSTVAASLGLGTESIMLLANRGDSLDTRLIFRFDTIPATIGSTTTPISFVDSVFLRLHFDSLAKDLAVPVTLTLYDVDSAGINDTSVADLDALFTPARVIGTRILAAGKAVDTVSVKLTNSVVLNKITTGKPLRIGVRVSAGSQSVSLRQPSSESASGAKLYLRISPDFTIPAVTYSPFTRVIGNNYLDAAALRDFTLVVRGTPATAGSMLAVGGVPATRSYLRFNIPDQIVDSSIVIRATLLLTQIANDSPDPTDSLFVQPYLGIAGSLITDPDRAAKITISQSQIPFDRLPTFAATSGPQEIEIVPAFTLWSLQTEEQLPRAIILQSTEEGTSPKRALFYSSEAVDPSVRPQLRISYTPRTRIGTP